MNATANRNSSIKFIDDAWQTLMSGITSASTRREIERYFKMERDEASAHPKIINKVQWSKAIILSAIINGANNPLQDLTFMYGSRDSINLAMIWGARHSVSIKNLDLSASKIDVARLDTEIR